MRNWVLLLAALLGLLLAGPASAHEVRPAYLELRQTSGDTYDVLWKVPALGDRRLAVQVEFPADVEPLGEPRGMFSGGAYVERWSVRCPGGLAGRELRIAGLAATQIEVIGRVQHANGATQTVRVLPGAPAFVVEAEPHALDVVRTYTVFGVEHILGGIDHLLFVFALILITHGGWRLVKTVTAFTLSHSLTLTAATLGWVHIPPPPVEAVIALSIVFVAAEILRQRRGVEGLTARAPWIVAFSFGLMHGLGFAGGLSAAGLPTVHIPTALLFFSLGVETGHFLFIGAVLSLIAAVRRIRVPIPRWVELVPPYAIGSLAMFWVIQRVAAF